MSVAGKAQRPYPPSPALSPGVMVPGWLLQGEESTQAQALGGPGGHGGQSLKIQSYLPWDTVFSFCLKLLTKCQTPGRSSD